MNNCLVRHYQGFLVNDQSGLVMVSIPAFPGCFPFGRNAEEAMQNGQQALYLHALKLQELGLPLPPALQLCEQELVIIDNFSRYQTSLVGFRDVVFVL